MTLPLPLLSLGQLLLWNNRTWETVEKDMLQLADGKGLQGKKTFFFNQCIFIDDRVFSHNIHWTVCTWVPWWLNCGHWPCCIGGGQRFAKLLLAGRVPRIRMLLPGAIAGWNGWGAAALSWAGLMYEFEWSSSPSSPSPSLSPSSLSCSHSAWLPEPRDETLGSQSADIHSTDRSSNEDAMSLDIELYTWNVCARASRLCWSSDPRVSWGSPLHSATWESSGWQWYLSWEGGACTGAGFPLSACWLNTV